MTDDAGFELEAWLPLPPLEPEDISRDLDGLTVDVAAYLERGPGDLDALVLVLDDGSVLGIAGRHEEGFIPPPDALDVGTVELFFGLLGRDESAGPSLWGRQAAARLTGVRLESPQLACADGVPRVLLVPLNEEEQIGISVVPTVTDTNEGGSRPRLEVVVALEGATLAERRAKRRQT